MSDDDIDEAIAELGADAETVARALLERADRVLEQLDQRAAAMAEIERRSAAMVDAQQHSSLRRP